MAWFSGKVSLGNFPDFAEAVNKLSESVKNIEKNFDNAIRIKEKSGTTGDEGEGSGIWPIEMAGYMEQKDEQIIVESPEMSDSLNSTPIGHKDGGESAVESLDKPDSSKPTSSAGGKQGENENLVNQENAQTPHEEAADEGLEHAEIERGSKEKTKVSSEEPKDNPIANSSQAQVMDGRSGEKIKDISEELKDSVTANKPEAKVIGGESGKNIKDTSEEPKDNVTAYHTEAEMVASPICVEEFEQKPEEDEHRASTHNIQQEMSEEPFPTSLEEMLPKLVDSLQTESTNPVGEVEDITSVSTATNQLEGFDDKNAEKEDTNKVLIAQAIDEASVDITEHRESSNSNITEGISNAEDNIAYKSPALKHGDAAAAEAASDLVKPLNDAAAKLSGLNQHLGIDANMSEKHSTGGISSIIVDPTSELEKVTKEMKMMEAALHGAARQAQAKADEIAKLLNENEELKIVINDLRRKTNEAEMESLREEYHQRVSALERKVYALTKERDTLRREQNKRSDAAALLKEKDEIITQVMAEGEQLSKKQASLEAQIRKLRAQVRELEEEKTGLLTKIEVEENKVESTRKDKATTEKLLQENIEKHQTELATQKEYYIKALNAAKEAKALAEARADSEARTELESHLREAEDRESMLVQTLEELRQTLSRKEQEAVFREDVLRRDIDDIQKQYQASERRCEELVTQVPESTRSLLRQIEAMQETATRKAGAWAAMERTLNSRLQEAEARAAAAEEKVHSVNERLTQTLSRMNVLEAQISCHRAEQTQLTRSLEKERQRAAENRQEFLALKELADTHESHAKQLEEEIKEIRERHKAELHEFRYHQEHLQQELEREKAARLDQEKASHCHSIAMPDQSPRARQSATFENDNSSRRISSVSSLNSMEESYFLQTTLGSPGNFSENRTFGEGNSSPHYMKGVISSTFEAVLCQKEGELASYASRLDSMESIRDSLAEELVKMTAQCEKLRTEAAALPGIRAELEALRQRHSAALELMGERDEELEELRADIVDLKEMYREQVNLLVNKIQRMSASMAAG